MVKKFTANCSFGGRTAPVTLYVGNPSNGVHPLNFQSKWLSDIKGGTIPSNIMDSFAKLAEISQKNKVSFEELCSYVIEELKANSTLEKDQKKASEFTDSALVETNKKEENK